MPILTATLPTGCVGINIPAPTTPNVINVFGHDLVEIPGGMFVMGSLDVPNAEPRWVSVDRFFMGRTLVSREQHDETHDTTKDLPWNEVSWFDGKKYLEESGHGLRLPTFPEWQCAARGPAVEMHAAMEQDSRFGAFRPQDFVEFAYARFENFVFGVKAHIVQDPKADPFQRLIRGAELFYGWRVHGTDSGMLTHENAWYEKAQPTDVNWGPDSAYGFKQMAGQLLQWTGDKYYEDAYYRERGMTPPATPHYMLQCGGFFSMPRFIFARAAYRLACDPSGDFKSHGLRVARGN